MPEPSPNTPVNPKANPLTTVTPLSKTLALILFISLPFLGFYLGVKYQGSATVQPFASNLAKIPSSSAPPLNTTRIIKNYDWLGVISFEYPDSWYLSESTSSGHPNLGTLRRHSTFVQDENLCIKITVSSESPGDTLDDVLRHGATNYDASKSDYIATSTKTLITTNGHQAKIREVTNNGNNFEDAAILLGNDRRSFGADNTPKPRPVFAYLSSCSMAESQQFHDVLMSFSVQQ